MGGSPQPLIDTFLRNEILAWSRRLYQSSHPDGYSFSYATSSIQLCAILFQRSPNHILTVELYFHRLVVIQINHADKKHPHIPWSDRLCMFFDLPALSGCGFLHPVHRHTPVLPFLSVCYPAMQPVFPKRVFFFSMYTSRRSTPSAYDSYSLICSTRMASACFSMSSMSTRRTVIDCFSCSP